MPDKRTHTRVSKRILGDLSLGEGFQKLLDRHQAELGPRHRAIDHTWERMEHLGKMYGEIGRAEILIHLALDYDLMPDWNPKANGR